MVIKHDRSKNDPLTAFFLQRLVVKVAKLNASISSVHVAGEHNLIPGVASRQGIAAV